LGAIVLGLGGASLQRRLGKGPVGWIACGTVALSFLVSVVAFAKLVGMEPEQRYLLARLFPWIHVGSLNVDVAFAVDPRSAGTILFATGVGGLSHPFSPACLPQAPP